MKIGENRSWEPGWVAIDPGPHTGIAVWFPDTGTFRTHTFDFSKEEEYVFLDTPHHVLWEWLNENVEPSDHLIVEKFEYDRDKARNSPALNFDAAEYVGVIKLWSEVNGSADFCCQTRGAVGKAAYWSDDKLRRLGLWKPGRESRHEMDATRHLLYHVTFCCKMQVFNESLRG